jgi:DNA-binding NarL/FixJ family response regulator
MSARVLVIDDHPLVRDGIAQSLERAGFTCVGQAACVKEAIAMIALHNPDLITVDINLPDGSGIEIIQWARKTSPSIAIVVLTLNNELDLIATASQAGAQAFISKAESSTVLISAIRSIVSNPNQFISSQTVALIGRDRAKSLLSPRELTVLTYLSGELSIADIAAQMFISHATAKTHIAAIYRKLDSHNRQSAVARARAIGIL